MKTELEPQDIQIIASQIVEMLRPLLIQKRKGEAEDRILSIEDLAQYLGVSPSWIYKQISFKAIPYFKVGKHPRFRKVEIDRWIQTQTVNPIPPLRTVKPSR
jgi:excisionase family DNA binding protein